MITIFKTAGAWIARFMTALGLSGLMSLAFLGPAGPILTGIANAIGAVITAVFEIAASLSKSAEGRILLGAALAAAGFFYLRFHYIEEGKTQAAAILAEAHKSCQTQLPQKRKR
jgi:hypothetical protein